jgi:hypothetical protein
VLALGLHVIYELARGLSGPSVKEVRAACQFLSEIRQVEYLPQLDAVVINEFDQAKHGLPILTVLPPINQFATRLELTRLTAGYADQAARFIASRETTVAAEHLQVAEANLRGLKALRSIRTFEEFRRLVSPSSASANLSNLAALHGIKLRPGVVARVLARPKDFRLLTAWLHVQWYFAWIATHHRVPPAWDKRDDFRHLLESARCDGFVTIEAALRKVGAVITPWRPCLSWEEFRVMLG